MTRVDSILYDINQVLGEEKKLSENSGNKVMQFMIMDQRNMNPQTSFLYVAISEPS